MSDTALVITVGYSVLTILGVTILLVVLRSTRSGFRARPAGRELLERGEARWGLAVVVFLVALLALTFSQVPYGEDTGGQAAQRLQLTGQQFAWVAKPSRVRAGVRTAVDLRAVDVSHAVGIYDPGGVLLKQVNVIPGVAQRFVITFPRSGTYELRCLEFCGVDHHLMSNQLEVMR